MRQETLKWIVLAIFLYILPSTFGKSDKELFRFVQLTDPQLGFISENKNCEEEIRLYAKTVRYINKIKPKFVVITGDLVHNRMDTNQVNSFNRITSSIHKSIPVYIIPGNHDIGMVPTQVSLDSFMLSHRSDRFEFTYKNVQFIGINSCLIQSGLKQDSIQFDWLKANLKKHPQMRKVLFTHQPFFTKTLDEKDNYDNIARPSRINYLQMMKDNGVVSVFSGHFHKNAEANYEGIDLVISSAVGKSLGDVGSGLRIVKVYKKNIVHQFIELKNISN